jgi:DNA-binding NarL/FixJ family response regulator
MPDAVDIVIAEDHDLVRRAVRRLLEAVDDFRIVGEAADGEEALTLVERYEPDVAILDLNMPQLNGFEAAQQMQDLPTQPKVIMLTMYSERDLVFRAFDVGCAAYVVKKSVSHELEDAIRHALDDRYFLSQDLHQLWSEVQERMGI